MGEGIRTPLAKEVLSHCDYVVTEVFDGAFEKVSKKAITDLLARGERLARTSLLGKRPDFAQLFSAETDYRKEWVANFKYMAQTVRRGVLLLDDDIGYLERDALLSGALEIPINQRYLYSPEHGTIQKFTAALKPGSEYEASIEERLVKTSLAGEAMAVQGLLKAKATPNTEDLHGESVLSCACNNGDTQTIKCLLVAKATINAKNKDGYSALHVACCRNQADAVSVLLKAKADLFARTNKGNAVLDFVKHEGHSGVLEVLQQERDNRKEAKAFAKENAKSRSSFFGGYF